MVCRRYRPRQPRASPVWQILHDRAAKRSSLHPEAAAAIQTNMILAIAFAEAIGIYALVVAILIGFVF